MKTIIRSYRLAAFIAALTAMALSSCTRNNGDIGDWFGTWRVESYTVDGTPATDYAPPYMIWKFQSGVIQILQPDDYTHDCPSTTGTWHQDGNDLYLDFTWGIGGDLDINPLPKQCKLTILKLSGRKIELQYVSDDNKTYIFNLQKWG